MEDIVSKVENMIMEQGFLEKFKIKPDTRFLDIPGWDDLDTVDLCMTIEDEFNIEISDEEYECFDNLVWKVIELIHDKIK